MPDAIAAHEHPLPDNKTRPGGLDRVLEVALVFGYMLFLAQSRDTEQEVAPRA